MKKESVPASCERFYEDLLENLPSFPASFCYAGKIFRGFPSPDFHLEKRESSETAEKVSDLLTISGPQGLTVTVKAAYWTAFGVSEWTLGFENRGKEEETGRLSDVACCDIRFRGKDPVLRGILGDHGNFYRPYSADLADGPLFFESLSGRPTHINFPYFNLEHGAGGTLIALGWAGTWRADFLPENGAVHFLGRSTVGISLFLEPGDSVRTALTVLAPYRGRNETDAMNFWRRWFLACCQPKADASGHPLKPFSTCFLASDTGLPNSDGSISERSTTWKPSLEKMFEVGVKTDFRWIDAGWYSDPAGNTVESDWYGTVGSWQPDPVKWPGHSLRQSVDFTRRHGMKTLLWFEPERVTDPESLVKNYGYRMEWAIRIPGQNNITNNIGNPACLKWTTERICRVLRENRIDMYREDNNSNPAGLWRYLDALDGRSGITECRMVEAHYRMWDDILETTKSYGGCAFCDSCASGGGRNDIESLRRGIPMLRSDSDRTSTSLRLSMTSSFNRWIPFCGANTKEKLGQLDPTGRSDVYTWRASYLPALNVDSQFVQDPGQDFSVLRFGLNEWKLVNSFLLSDFYLLTPWHPRDDRTGFTAYSYFDPERRKGVLFLFRMEECGQAEFSFTLPYAERQKLVLRDADGGAEIACTPGMTISVPEKRTAKLFFVEPARKPKN